MNQLPCTGYMPCIADLECPDEKDCDYARVRKENARLRSMLNCKNVKNCRYYNSCLPQSARTQANE